MGLARNAGKPAFGRLRGTGTSGGKLGKLEPHSGYCALYHCCCTHGHCGPWHRALYKPLLPCSTYTLHQVGCSLYGAAGTCFQTTPTYHMRSGGLKHTTATRPGQLESCRIICRQCRLSVMMMYMPPAYNEYYLRCSELLQAPIIEFEVALGFDLRK